MQPINKNSGIKVMTNIKAGGLRVSNHSRVVATIRVKSGLKAGAIRLKNHNVRLASQTAR